MDTPTPRTDELYLNIQQADEDVAFNAMHDLARQLELEIAALTRERDEARNAIARYGCHLFGCLSIINTDLNPNPCTCGLSDWLSLTQYEGG